jgi:hypothetical protein
LLVGTGVRVAFAAQLNPKNSTDPTAAIGHVVQEFVDGTGSGKVTCLKVMGNMASITYLVDSGRVADIGQYRTFMVVDNGEPNMGISPDMYNECGNQSGNCGTSNCTFQQILRGNIVVSSGS